MIAISGGMVASFALPASAATLTPEVKTAVNAATEALAAPTTPLATPAFGNIDFTGIAKPAPVAPVVAVSRSTQTVSRSATRTAVSSTAAQAAPSGGVLGIAASLAGISYVYGGTTPAGFDCSGFTQYVFGQLGISLPRTAEQQRQFATPVSNPQPGDLVFFGAPAYHNGIYAGNGMMWDSPRTGKAVALRAIWTSAVSYGRVS